MNTKHEEFPELTPEALAAFKAARSVSFDDFDSNYFHIRICLSAFLREAVLQVFPGYAGLPSSSHSLLEMADNLHSPPPPPPPSPTLAQARAADLETQEGIETVRAFLAALGEGGQP
jgi:hypothetical protein